jgi:formylglycine-generating enzyme required for sulfatase activity
LLPTEQQWQYAAQADDNRIYPWGNNFDPQHCNTFESGINRLTAVYHYDTSGVSPFGVSDMSGNIWELCLTKYEHDSNNMEGDGKRVTRGGSFLKDRESARVTNRTDSGYAPGARFHTVGFRVAWTTAPRAD